MKLSIQGTLYDTQGVTLRPEIDVTCLNCNRSDFIQGEPIPYDDGILLAEDVESSIEQAMKQLGWEYRICPSCIGYCPDLPRLYNQPDRHDED